MSEDSSPLPQPEPILPKTPQEKMAEFLNAEKLGIVPVIVRIDPAGPGCFLIRTAYDVIPT